MIRSNYARALMLSAILVAAHASTLLAHGGFINPPPPPPPPNLSSSGGSGSLTTGGYDGPAGGATPGYNGPTGGGTFGGEGGSGGVTGAPAPSPTNPGSGAPATRPEAPRTGGTTGIGRSGPTNPGRAKGTRTPWTNNLSAPWKAAFLESESGYDANLTNLAASVKSFTRNEALAMVLVYDSSNKHHHGLIELLDQDARFAAPAQLFDCFKIDAHGLSKNAVDVKLSIYKADGSLALELVGEQKVRKAADALVDTWKAATGKDLSPAMHNLVAAINGIAYCDFVIAQTESLIVCPDCGQERQEALDRIKELKTKRVSFKKVIDDQRKSA